MSPQTRSTSAATWQRSTKTVFRNRHPLEYFLVAAESLLVAVECLRLDEEYCVDRFPRTVEVLLLTPITETLASISPLTLCSCSVSLLRQTKYGNNIWIRSRPSYWSNLININNYIITSRRILCRFFPFIRPSDQTRSCLFTFGGLRPIAHIWYFLQC